MPADLPIALTQVLHDWRDRGPVPAVTMAVSLPGEPIWVGTAGTTERNGTQAVPPHARFRIASITKMFVATVVLQLVEEQRLSLEDPLRIYVPEVHDGDRITIRQLLNHSSGIPDYSRVENLRQELLANRQRRWTTDDVLALVSARKRAFPPGDGYEYSNTNYVLLGEVIAEVTRSSWAQEVRQRILDPLGLENSFVAGYEPIPGGVLPGYFDADNDGDTENVWGGPWPAMETLEGAAGAMVSTASDVARFATALFRGDLLEPASLAAMLKAGPYQPRLSRYGLGVELLWPDRETLVVGHGGFLPGFKAVVWYAPAHALTIVAQANETRANVQDLAELALRNAVSHVRDVETRRDP